jgi:hypothetical protein|tara:strand:+ start:730 stop:906 length:177 start_codon:yes stop_codon:yes gene_type:complete
MENGKKINGYCILTISQLKRMVKFLNDNKDTAQVFKTEITLNNTYKNEVIGNVTRIKF